MESKAPVASVEWLAENGRGGWTSEIAIGCYDAQAFPPGPLLQGPALSCVATSWLDRARIVKSN